MPRAKKKLTKFEKLQLMRAWVEDELVEDELAGQFGKFEALCKKLKLDDGAEHDVLLQALRTLGEED